jgi:sortase A
MPRSTIRKSAELALVGAGVALCIVWLAARIHGEVGRRVGLAQFEAARTRPAPPTPSASPSPSIVDDSLWSQKRVQAYKESFGLAFPAPLAVLRIPRARVEVPVLPGTDDATLNRAVGWIQGTARPGEKGNVGIAGHRDGFFRGLKDLSRGDPLTLETKEGPEEYVVDEIRIVSPEEVSVLEETPSSVVTLVTCYPFYFVGDAPSRYIVRAVRNSKVQRVSDPR